MEDFKLGMSNKALLFLLIRLTLRQRKKIVSCPISNVFVVSERELGDKSVFHVTSD